MNPAAPVTRSCTADSLRRWGGRAGPPASRSWRLRRRAARATARCAARTCGAAARLWARGQAQLWMPRVAVFVAVLALFPAVVVGGVLVLVVVVVALDALEGATVVVGAGTVMAWND